MNTIRSRATLAMWAALSGLALFAPGCSDSDSILPAVGGEGGGAGSGGSAGSGGKAGGAGSGGKAGAGGGNTTAGSAGASAGSGGASAGSGGASAGSGGASAGSGGASAGSGGATAGTGGASAGSGGASAGSGGASAGSGGATAGSGGATAGSGGATAGSGGATAGSGGATAGSGGAIAGSGGAIAGSGGAIAGSGGAIAGSGGSAGSGGASPCGGCAVLIAPLATQGDHLRTQTYFISATDLTGVTITVRACAVRGNGNSVLQVYAQNGGPSYNGGYNTGLYEYLDQMVSCSVGLQDYAFTVVADGAFVPSAVTALTVQLLANGPTGPWITSEVHVDSITLTGNVLGPFTFTTNSDPLGVNNAVPNTSTLTWIP